MNIRVGHHCRNHQVCLDLWLIAASFDLHRLTRQQTACTEHKHSQPSFHSLPPFSPVFCQRKTCSFRPRLSDGHEPFVPEILSLLLSSLGTRMLSDVRQAALEFRTEIGRFGRDLDGHASGFTPIEPRNENRPIVILGSMFSGVGYAAEKFSL